MKISKSFEKMVGERYKEMKEGNISEDFLDRVVWGELKIFISKKPRYVLFSTEINSDQIYVGSESM